MAQATIRRFPDSTRGLNKVTVQMHSAWFQHEDWSLDFGHRERFASVIGIIQFVGNISFDIPSTSSKNSLHNIDIGRFCHPFFLLNHNSCYFTREQINPRDEMYFDAAGFIIYIMINYFEYEKLQIKLPYVGREIYFWVFTKILEYANFTWARSVIACLLSNKKSKSV